MRPHRKDGYRHRCRVHVRVDVATVDRLDELASCLSLSRAHLCDLLLGIVVDDEPTWLRDRIMDRVDRALRLQRSRRP